ncbi:hypothetical protein A4U88_1172 [Serratia marcescens]|nr:hypothetical protein A4U88_1172 [Serratia marcescens]
MRHFLTRLNKPLSFYFPFLRDRAPIIQATKISSAAIY